jgi:hypothetical protein
LEPSINGFKPVKGVQQLHASFAHLIRSWSKLLGVLDGETDSIDRDSRLVRHFEFGRRWPRLYLGFDDLQKLAHGI